MRLLRSLALALALVGVAEGVVIQPGTVALGPFHVNNNHNSYTINVDVSQQTDPAICWTVSAELSYDNEVTWEPAGGVFTPRCGCSCVDKVGNPVTTASVTVGMRPGTGRRLRGTYTL